MQKATLSRWDINFQVVLPHRDTAEFKLQVCSLKQAILFFLERSPIIASGWKVLTSLQKIYVFLRHQGWMFVNNQVHMCWFSLAYVKSVHPNQIRVYIPAFTSTAYIAYDSYLSVGGRFVSRALPEYHYRRGTGRLRNLKISPILAAEHPS